MVMGNVSDVLLKSQQITNQSNKAISELNVLEAFIINYIL